MTFTSYAQNFEDVMLMRALSDVVDGRYLDVGAQDPSEFSVSRAFFEAGWRGVHVEPVDDYAKALMRERPGDLVIRTLVGTQPAQDFFIVPGTGLSTTNAEVAERYRKEYSVQKVEQTTTPLSDILSNFGAPIHWMKIDVEGAEADVLNSWGDCAVQPWVLCIEAVDAQTHAPVHLAWETALTDRGYQFVYFDGLNRFYVHSSQVARGVAFSAGVNIFDDFVLQDDHPFIRAFAAQKTRDLRREMVDPALAKLAEQAETIERIEAARLSAVSAISTQQDLVAQLQADAALNDSALRTLRDEKSANDSDYEKRLAEQAALLDAQEAERQRLESYYATRLAEQAAALDGLDAERTRLEVFYPARLAEQADNLEQQEVELNRLRTELAGIRDEHVVQLREKRDLIAQLERIVKASELAQDKRAKEYQDNLSQLNSDLRSQRVAHATARKAFEQNISRLAVTHQAELLQHEMQISKTLAEKEALNHALETQTSKSENLAKSLNSEMRKYAVAQAGHAFALREMTRDMVKSKAEMLQDTTAERDQYYASKLLDKTRQVETLSKELYRVNVAYEQVDRDLSLTRASTSWQVTGPLRRVTKSRQGLNVWTSNRIATPIKSTWRRGLDYGLYAWRQDIPALRWIRRGINRRAGLAKKLSTTAKNHVEQTDFAPLKYVAETEPVLRGTADAKKSWQRLLKSKA